MNQPHKKTFFDFRVLSCIVVVLCILFLSIGFSSFYASMDISNIIALISAQRNIRVTNIIVENTENNATSSYEEYSSNSITSNISLPNSNSKVTYNIAITNIGNVEMGILEIDGLPSNLTYSIANYNLKDILCDDNDATNCKLGSTKTLEITIEYKSNGYNSSNTNYLLNLSFTFARGYNITYNGFSNTSSLPKTILEGDSITINFNNTTGIPYDVSVTKATANYVTPNLTVSNPTDNVVINRYFGITYNLNGGTNSNNNPDRFLLTDSITLEDPTYSGYVFDGWYESSDFSGNAITSITNRNSNVVLYAKWINTITYILNGGTQANNQVMSYQRLVPQTILNPENHHDATFGGWYENSGFSGSAVTSTSQLSGNATLYAKWTSSISNTNFDTTTNRFTASNVSSVSLKRFTASANYQYTQNAANTSISSVKLFISYRTSNGAKLATIYCQVTSNTPGFTTVQNNVQMPINGSSVEMNISLNTSIQKGYNYSIRCNNYNGDGNGKYSINGFEFLINPDT